VSAGLELVQKDIGTIIDHNGSGSEELRAVLELTQDMSEAAETAMNFVNDLLHYESMDAGLFTIETSQVMPDSLIKATTLNIIAKRNNLNLVVVQPREIPESCFVMADLNRIDQVIRNLVVNACKFTSSGGTVTVETSIINEVMKQPQGQALAPHAEICGSVRVKVCDDGVGISKENQTKLFKQFVQFNRNELQGGGGSGLGLWIARTIVNLHFGELAFESEGIGRGSSFFFELPLFKNTSHVSIPALHPAMSGIQVHPEPENRAMMTKSAGAETKNCSLQSARDDEAPPVIEFGSTEQDNTLSFDTLPPISFMIVDDLPMNRKILRRMIESEPSLRGCTILDVEDGCEVVKVMSVENFPVDRSCIFMDSIMKYVHGPEVVRDLRNRGFKGVIIGVTGNAMQHDIDEFVGCGLDRLILKPLKRDILMSALESVGLIRDTKKIYESPTGASKYP
jgi:CheY-like chemotaxis protein